MPMKNLHSLEAIHNI